MMTVNENTISQSIDYQNYAINRTYPSTYNYPHEHPWQKSSFPIYPPQSTLFSNIENSYRPTSLDGHFYRPTTMFNTDESPLNYPSTNHFFHWNHLSYPNYSSPFYNPIPSTTNYPVLLPPPQAPASKPANTVKKPKRPRLTARIRSEILKIKSSRPTISIWEIQQSLLQNGTCTSPTLPNASTIQRVFNDSIKSTLSIKHEPKVTLTLPSVTICLSPSPSPTCSNSEAQVECSICLETYRSGQEVSILACSHEYHSSCIAQWMMKNRSCPMCRKDIHNQPQFVTLLI